MRARINAGGREVELDAPDTGVSARELADKALEVWRGTEGAGSGADLLVQLEPVGGPAFGLQAVPVPGAVEPMAHGAYSRPVREIKA